MRIILYSALTAALFFCFFYFYPADIFEAEIKGSVGSVTTDVSLQALLFKQNLPGGLLAKNVQSISLTVRGILVLGVCLLALPIMIGFRFGRKS